MIEKKRHFKCIYYKIYVTTGNNKKESIIYQEMFLNQRKFSEKGKFQKHFLKWMKRKGDIKQIDDLIQIYNSNDEVRKQLQVGRDKWFHKWACVDSSRLITYYRYSFYEKHYTDDEN